MIEIPILRDRRPACPICRRPEAEEFRPFCSQRCADVDLGRWLNERYAIPEELDPDAPPPAPDSED
ncbi:DNA gyrase inhibitor YacG [Methylobacterium sp. J-048]|uniref:DNA gyrase inhibitor YacG n=1 Tax=Methylobacterium sp. J-048 TaxID=2836635 RepID=UPI001FB88B94|nr:DNA gyrase inhibitor YacG [Methylobacterium sp. J-048]MCJ2057733.1 DNA gyrase inhibitor YacG [Methylobacterium sp. J-048]